MNFTRACSGHWLLASAAIVAAGVVFGWRVYSEADAHRDPLEVAVPATFGVLQNKFYFDEIYRDTAIAFYNFAGKAMAVVEDVLWRATVQASSVVRLAVAWFNRLVDEFAVNGGFDSVTRGLRRPGATAVRSQNRPVSNLSSRDQSWRGRAGPALRVGVQMNGFPDLTILTLTPVVAALLLAGLDFSRRRSARLVALVSSWSRFRTRSVCGAVLILAYPNFSSSRNTRGFLRWASIISSARMV